MMTHTEEYPKSFTQSLQCCATAPRDGWNKVFARMVSSLASRSCFAQDEKEKHGSEEPLVQVIRTAVANARSQPLTRCSLDGVESLRHGGAAVPGCASIALCALVTTARAVETNWKSRSRAAAIKREMHFDSCEMNFLRDRIE
jgi:hypothetical protein